MYPPQYLIDELVMEQSAESAMLELKDMGYTINVHPLHKRISQLIYAGIRKPISHSTRAAGAMLCVDVQAGASLEGCERLLEAQIRAGQVMPVPMAAWEARHGVAA